MIAVSPNAAIPPYVASAVATPSPDARPTDATLREGPADDEQADRADGGGDREAEDEAPAEQFGSHGCLQA